jgi:hypothetical protein
MKPELAATLRLFVAIVTPLIIALLTLSQFQHADLTTRIEAATVLSGVCVGLGTGLWEGLDPDLVLWDHPSPPLRERLPREVRTRGWALLSRAFAWGYGGFFVLACLLAIGTFV